MAGLSARIQDQLNRDLGYGQPVTYRKVPGRSGWYYNPSKPENPPVSAHYVNRVYKPALNELQQQQLRQGTEQDVRLQSLQKGSVYDTWLVKQASLGVRNPSDADFNATYQRYLTEKYAARSQGIEVPGREAKFEPGSPYANALVDVGRRTGEEDFAVGESPTHAGPSGSYINDVVLPYLRNQVQRSAASEARLARQELARERRLRGI